MKKFILSLLFGIVISFSLSSCITDSYAQDVIITDGASDVDFSIIVRYGTPYYYESSLLYYLYNGWYYYPYVRNNHYYYRRYSRPLPPPKPRHHGAEPRPHHNDRPHVAGGNRSFGSSTRVTPPPANNRINGGVNRSGSVNNRPIQQRQPQIGGSVNRTPQVRSGGGSPAPRGGSQGGGNRGFGGRR
jgi:hypothetical protein